MTLFAWMLLAAVLIGNTTGQLLLKAASIHADRLGENGHWHSLLANPLVWLGLVIYVAEFLLWLAFVSVVPLWQAVMVACIDILMVMIGGRIFFAEKITPQRMGAISLIAAGVLMVGLGGN